jgi:tyrosinase
MRVSLLSVLSVVSLVSGAAVSSSKTTSSSKQASTTKSSRPGSSSSLAPALPMETFGLTAAEPISLADAQSGGGDEVPAKPKGEMLFAIAATNKCANLRVRREWDTYSNSDRQAFIDALKCLLGRPPSGQFRAATSRYEDMAELHQSFTPSVHGNSKFLLWHRYFLWTFEQVLRSECGFNRDLPWFDETRFAGRFEQSSIFSSRWFGRIDIGGDCVRDGVSFFIHHTQSSL